MRRRRRHLRRRSLPPSAAALLSVLWPGLGHLGHSTDRGLLLIGTTLIATLLGLTYITTRSAATLLAWAVSGPVLRIMVAGALLSLVFRSAVAIDAYRTASLVYRHRHAQRKRRAVTVATLVLVVAIISAPHVIAIRFAMAQFTLLSTVFDTSGTQTATASPVSTTTYPITSVAVTAAHQHETPAPDPTPARTTAMPSTTLQSTAGEGTDRLTIALLGSDAGFDRSGVRTDTIIVLSVEVATGDAAAFNIPRNWKYLTFPEGTPASELWPDGYPRIANEVYALGLRFPEAFPGVEDKAGYAIKSALSQLTGLDVQYYVLLGMQGFVEIVNLFGGIDVLVTESINDRIKPIVHEGPAIDIVVEPGEHHLDGLTALGYVRSRTGTSDYHRMTRQRCVVGALIDQVTLARVLANFLPLTDIIADHVATDIPLDRLDEFMVLVKRLDTSRVVTVNFIPPEFPRGPAPVARVRAAVDRALEGRTNATNSSLAESCRHPQ